jgi:alkanesulfonate monooxygenase SsuD/methylene tetrahydromethanopterin reductase-like flavin-dependent oxidoreductase (luciferase family)
VEYRVRLAGLDTRPDLPIFVAALSPGMLQLAGEIGDGVMLWLCNPNYIRDVVLPAVRTGREWTGRTVEGFEIVAAVPGALTGEPAGAYAALRSELLTYFSSPFYRRMLERSGTAPTSPRSTPPGETSTGCARRSPTSS